jgi:peptidyl-prolyl cis-trans isomerase A (cyclophilin A)
MNCVSKSLPRATGGLLRRSVFGLVLLAAASVQAAGPATHPKVKFATSMGDIVIELNTEAAPKTVASILKYVKAKHYDGLVFHRVIDNFMIQTGGMKADMVEKPTSDPVPHEGRIGLAMGLKNTVGTVAMARTNDPNSGKAQFFINVKDNAFLDPVAIPDGDPVTFDSRGSPTEAPRADALRATAGYTVFGKVLSGMDVVNKIKLVPTTTVGGHQNVPVTPVVITSATLEK